MRFLLTMFLLICALPLKAADLRIATYNTELERDGPGLLLRDIKRGEAQVTAVTGVIAAVAPDILVLQGVDYDHDLAALHALRIRLAGAGADYPYVFARQPNSGLPTGLDMDGNGQMGQAADAQGYGRFSGQGGMAILSRYPVDMQAARDFSDVLWRDLLYGLLPEAAGAPFPSAAAQAVQRLSSVAHWVVPVKVGRMRLILMTYHATPPVFDGPEDRNGRRNHDENRFWQHYLAGLFGAAAQENFVLLGDANLDPLRGEGRKEAIRTLLNHPRLQDPKPRRPDGGMETVAWDAVGEMRVDYILPSADLKVTGSGVHWPENGAAADLVKTASRHRLVWVDIRTR